MVWIGGNRHASPQRRRNGAAGRYVRAASQHLTWANPPETKDNWKWANPEG
jgi:hypothetical protein